MDDTVTTLEYHTYNERMEQQPHVLFMRRDVEPITDPLRFARRMLESDMLNRRPMPAYVEVQRYIGGGVREVIALYEVKASRCGHLYPPRDNEAKNHMDLWILED